MRGAMRTLRVLLRKEFLQIRRDPVILRMLLVMPIIQLLVLANAATFEVKESRLWVVDLDHSAMSRGAVERLTGSGRFVAAGRSATAVQADDALLDGEADVILLIPAGFERDLVRERRAAVQLVLNAENGSQAGVTQAYAGEILGRYAAELNVRLTPQARIAEARAAPPPVRGQPLVEISRRSWYTEALDDRLYMVPGILVQLVTIVGTLMTALNIVREKEAGTLDQLNVTPIPRAVFIAAKLIPLWSIGLVVLAFGLVIGRVVFGVPMEGSLLLVFAAAAVYLVAALGIGLLVSTIAETQQQALFVTFALLMVYILMSGLFTPVSGMPTWVQWVAQVNPLLHFIQIMRGVLLKGAGLADVARQLAILMVGGALILTVAVRRYRKRAV
jgi:ABC-2 type transport system permease protein